MHNYRRLTLISREEREAIEWLREWAREGFPRRVDGSFPVDFLTAMRRLTGVPMDAINSRQLELALCAGPDFDHIFRDRATPWSWEDTKRAREALERG